MKQQKDNTASASKKWLAVKRVLNIVIGVSVGCLIGRVLWIIVDYNANPDLYATYSAPWYTQIIVALLFGGIAILFEVFALLFVRHKLNETPVIGIIERKNCGGIDMNNEKKISLFAVVINCICAVVWNLNLFVDLMYGYSNNISFYLHIACAVIWDVIAVYLLVRYRKYKNQQEK